MLGQHQILSSSDFEIINRICSETKNIVNWQSIITIIKLKSFRLWWLLSPHNLKDFRFIVIESMQNTTRDLEEILFMREGYWAAQLNTLQPFGLNKRCKFWSSKRIIAINANDADLLDQRVPIVIIVIYSFLFIL